MNETSLSIAIVIVAIGFFCAGYAWGSRRETYWRIKWIELEHDSARAEDRKPRDINIAYKSWQTPK